ncbi:LysM peptidoglycan-binding domain-containing protein [Halalkalibacter akibai]|uniref:Membrane-bound lytic murein transglycosylase D n=1 Tax=Halalkalibacter akibai (strain ATCC 43226 / DSM 21942 / CIP 109018 / JCM 9157 / 1139) TaxID=1236973 RepID=W4R0A6_HALA3|nr:LysM peptidoglycan-binding domain-containing protein [Halalkalibacter akibai]GAE36979.1 membrane-bound lytic murein transglycosylase D precursor [Halalkalibacter akibai JCM 9157]
MNTFSHHKIIQSEKGLEIILYVDQHLEEFAFELGAIQERKKQTLEQEAYNYIKAKCANIKVQAVKIMGGTILISTMVLGVFESNVAKAAGTTQNVQQQPYKVQAGDTLWNIASRFNTTVHILRSANQLTTDILQVGQTILVPSSVDTNLGVNIYQVVAGDTLSGIAARYGVSVIALREANQLSTDFLRIGQSLTIPNGVHIPTQQPVTTGQSHQVVNGDTLSGIAARYGTTVNALREANRLTSDIIRIGQTLTIPNGSQPPVQQQPVTTGASHQVVAGDTLSGIAARYGTTVNALREVNRLTNDIIRIGQTLTIPNGQQAPVQQQPVTTGSSSHQVVAGDTLSGIAARYGTTVNALREANGLSNDIIRVGQTLVIPTRSAATPTSTAPTDVVAPVNQAELDWLARIIFCEARGEPVQGQIAVAAVILNRVKSSLFPNSVEGVILERNNGHFQFTPVGTGAIYTANPTTANFDAARRALTGEDPTNGSLYFYNPNRTNDQWIRSRTVSTQIGNHVFAF